MTRRYVLLAFVLAAAPAVAQPPDPLILETPERRLVLTAADLAALPRDTATVSFHENPAQRYEGVPIHVLLKEAGVRADSTRGRALRMRVVIDAADGYRAVLSLAEVDPTLPDRRALLADRVDGTPLTGNEAPFRLLLVGDPRHNRWVRQVVAIRVRTDE
jgi:DMSO/TMAO reductase YedYZ molybdopterin-dependent catalytic subunit